MGIHSLDLLCWWLGRKPEVVIAETDSFGGPESMAELQLRSDDCDVRLRVSWLSPLANRYTIVGDAGKLSGKLERWDRVTITSAAGRQTVRRPRHSERDYNGFGRTLIQNFVEVVGGCAPPLVSGEGVLPAMQLMEECYSAATLMEMPWMHFEESQGDVFV
jgi:predicted dehydrogenase